MDYDPKIIVNQRKPTNRILSNWKSVLQSKTVYRGKGQLQNSRKHSRTIQNLKKQQDQQNQIIRLGNGKTTQIDISPKDKQMNNSIEKCLTSLVIRVKQIGT